MALTMEMIKLPRRNTNFGIQIGDCVYSSAEHFAEMPPEHLRRDRRNVQGEDVFDAVVS
jgi:hypothetical protein